MRPARGGTVAQATVFRSPSVSAASSAARLSVASREGCGANFTFVLTAPVPRGDVPDDPLAGSFEGARVLAFLRPDIVGQQVLLRSWLDGEHTRPSSRTRPRRWRPSVTRVWVPSWSTPMHSTAVFTPPR